MLIKDRFKLTIRLLTKLDIVTLGYLLTTLFYIILSSNLLIGEWLHILIRIFLIVFIIWISTISRNITDQFWLLLRNTYALLLFGFFYAETDYLNNILFENLDPLFEKIELRIFGVHPSIMFSNLFPQGWFNELMNLGYFSYYFLIILLPLWLWYKKSDSYQYIVFIITSSFYIFYWIFILFPVAGPQFYLEESLRTIPDSGMFRWLVKLAEWIGEGPTAAFPSSHVGIVVIMGFLSYKFARELLWVYIVFGVLICFSTVYIKAHYAIDVFGGIIIAPLLFWISNKLYKTIRVSDE